MPRAISRTAELVRVTCRMDTHPRRFEVENGDFDTVTVVGIDQAEGLLYALAAVLAEVKRQDALPAI